MGSNIYATHSTPNILTLSIAMPSRIRKLCDVDIADVTPALEVGIQLREFMILGLNFSCVPQLFP